MTPSFLKVTPATLRRWKREGIRVRVRRSPKEMMCIKDIMRHLGVSRSTVLRWRRKGCPYHTVGKAVRLSLRAVLRWRKKGF